VSAKLWKEKARQLKSDIRTLYLAYRSPKVPWYAKALIALIIAYALSPVDLIPDFVPVLGYLDDLIIIPLGVFIVLKTIPKEVLRECRGKVKHEAINSKLKWIIAFVIVLIWLLVIVALIRGVIS